MYNSHVSSGAGFIAGLANILSSDNMLTLFKYSANNKSKAIFRVR